MAYDVDEMNVSFRKLGIPLGCCILLAAFCYIQIRPMLLGGPTTRFGHDLSDYASAHSGELPRDWSILNEWLEIQGRSTWREETLDDSFRINLSRVVNKTEMPNYVSVIDDRIEAMEYFINGTIHSSRFQIFSNDE